MFLSILTLTNYDNTIWSGFNVPTGLDKNAIIKEICLQCAEMALVYPDVDIMKTAITNWSDSNQYTWNKLYETTQLSYNPLWNVDATITESNSGANVSSSSSGNTESVKGYNSNTWADHTKDDGSASGSGEWSEARSMTRTGNIGVTSSQELLERQRKVAEFNIYNVIVNSFKKRFCLMVY